MLAAAPAVTPPAAVETDTSVQARDASTLTKHIDNDQADIDVADFDVTKSKDFRSYKASMLQLLAGIKATITAANVAGQKGQIEGNQAYAAFKNAKGSESEQLLKKAEEIIVNVKPLEKILFSRKREWESCNNEKDLVENSWMTANFAYNTAYGEYELKKKEILDEVLLFEYVVKMYEDNVNNAG